MIVDKAMAILGPIVLLSNITTMFFAFAQSAECFYH